MVYRKSWLDFRRMQDVAALASLLIYGAALIQGYLVLPGGGLLFRERLLIWPGLFALISFAVPLAILPVRKQLARYVWGSFHAGFGQSPPSVLTGIGLLFIAAIFLFWQIDEAGRGGRYPTGIFSAFGAGIGILLAQVWLVRVLQRDPLTWPKIKVD
jgi:hypothetical protein